MKIAGRTDRERGEIGKAIQPPVGATDLVITELVAEQRIGIQRAQELLLAAEEPVVHALFVAVIERGPACRARGDVNWQMFDLDLVDEIILMQLPVIIGGLDNISLVDGAGYRDIELVKRFRLQEVVPKTNYLLLRFEKDTPDGS